MALEYHRSYNYAESSEDKKGGNEIRLTLQGILFNFIDRTTIQHRYRLEQQWIENGDRQRARYRVQVTIPIKSKSVQKGIFYINTSNEFMVDIGPDLGLSQNRLYVAPGYQFGNSRNLQIGYMLISKPGVNFSRLQFFITQKLKLYKE